MGGGGKHPPDGKDTRHPGSVLVYGDERTSENVWPYNLPVGSRQSSGCLPYPLTQPALLPFIGCGPYVQ